MIRDGISDGEVWMRAGSDSVRGALVGGMVGRRAFGGRSRLQGVRRSIRGMLGAGEGWSWTVSDCSLLSLKGSVWNFVDCG